MTDAELHDALLRHALSVQGWAGPGSDLTGIPLMRMLIVERTRAKLGQATVADRAVAAIYVAFNYAGSKELQRSPVVFANGNAVCVLNLETPKTDDPTHIDRTGS